MKQSKKIYVVLVTMMLICGVVIGAMLTNSGLRYSYYSLMDENLTTILLTDNILIHVLLIAAGCGFLWLADYVFCKKLSTQTQEKFSLVFLIVSAVVLFAVGTIYVQTNPYYPIGDQLNTTAGAYYCKNGNYMMLTPGGYIALYEQQKGFMFLYEILFTLFGDFCYKVAAEFHVLFAVGALLAGYGFIKLHFRKVFYRSIYCVVMLFCFPFMFFFPYIYGDVPSICFCIILFWALSAYGKKFQKRYIVISVITATLSLMCRMNTWIVLIAVGIGMLLLAIQKWNYRPLIAALCIVLAAAGTIKAVNVMYEYRSGYESGTGIPSILWIAMGLQDTNGEAGVYNRYQQAVFGDNNFEKEPSIQVGKEYISLRLQEFKENPDMAKDFFWRKMSSQWTEPLFESLAATKFFKEGETMPEWMNRLYFGGLRDTVWKGSNYYQSMVYAALFLFSIGSLLCKKKGDNCATLWIPQVAIIGGFLFSLMWENQCRYCLPYYVFMLLYVPCGTMQIGYGIEKIVGLIKQKRTQVRLVEEKNV